MTYNSRTVTAVSLAAGGGYVLGAIPRLPGVLACLVMLAASRFVAPEVETVVEDYRARDDDDLDDAHGATDAEVEQAVDGAGFEVTD